MKQITQTCGWCKQPVEHSVMSYDFLSTGVVAEQNCPHCGASLVPFETPDQVALIDRAGKEERKVGEPAWSILGKPGS